VIHDIYLGRLAEEGLVSVLMLFGFSFQIFRAGLFKWRRKLKDKWFNHDTLTLFAAIMVCFHIGGMVIDYRYFDLINVFYFLLAGIIYGYRNVDYGFGQAEKRDLPSRQYV
jgi:O-antigen ligase